MIDVHAQTDLDIEALAVSCSHNLVEPMPEEPSRSCVGARPLTKSWEPVSSPEEAELLCRAQRNHYLILMHHVELRDSVYVQTLTEDDMCNLKITDEEQAFSEGYVDYMNSLIKQQ